VPPENNTDAKTEELTALLEEIRNRVRARYPGPDALQHLQIPLPDLTPLVHARDAAEAKVASIGTVNPRRGGLLNALAQMAKKWVARSLDWHVREQVEFNRNVMSCVETTLEALNETKRSLAAFGGALEGGLQDVAEVKDMRAHWSQWRIEWERKLFINETQFLRSVADLQGAYQHRATLMESSFRDIARSQHADYLGALDRSNDKFWDELLKSRRELERLIHEELHLLRQRAGRQTAVAPGVETAPLRSRLGNDTAGESTREAPFDYARFAERFRGSEDYVRKNVQFYVPRFAGRAPVLDIGCGRGEFLEATRNANIEARGIDLSEDCVACCREKGLEVERADLFAYLSGLPDGSLGGIFCAQVIEHLPPASLPDMIRLASQKLSRDGLLALETPNPECLAIFASHFYLDPTHTRPVPHPLAAFYMEESGLGLIEVRQLSPALESMPALASLPEDFRNAFFGGLDYAIFGTKL